MTAHDPDGRDRDTRRFRFDPLDSAALDGAELAPDWAIEDLFLAGQPAVLAGPRKAMKTSLAVDLAVSLGTGSPALGHFPVPRQVPVAVLSGESGAATVRETARRVCGARRVQLAGAGVYWQFGLPRLSDRAELDELAGGLAARGVRVVVIDPLNVAVLAAGGAAAAADLFDAGPVLAEVTAACLAAGATPLFVHGVRRGGTPGGAAGAPRLTLDDLSSAGLGEFFPQWLLLDRMSPYHPGSGRHELVLTVGGSAGHAGEWQLRVDEGVPARDLSGRRWDVQVRRTHAAGYDPVVGRPGHRPRVGPIG